MIKYSVFYPNLAGRRFDMDYYVSEHLPMVRARLGAACKGVVLDAGLSGVVPGTAPAYLAILHLFFESVEEFQANFAPHIQEFRADVPNYTDIEPTRQISDIKVHIGPSES